MKTRFLCDIILSLSVKRCAHIIKKSRRPCHCCWICCWRFHFMLNWWAIASMDRTYAVLLLFNSKEFYEKHKQKILLNSIYAVRCAMGNLIYRHEFPFTSVVSTPVSTFFRYILTIFSFVHLSSEFIHTREASKRNNNNYERIGSYFPKNEKRVSKLRNSPASGPISTIQHSILYYTVSNFWWAGFEQNIASIVWSCCFVFIHFHNMNTFTMLVWFGLVSLWTILGHICNFEWEFQHLCVRTWTEQWAKSQEPSFKFPYSCLHNGFSFLSIYLLVVVVVFFS